MGLSAPVPLLGCDFSSSPTPRKPIVVAWGALRSGRVQLQTLTYLPSLAAFSDLLVREPAWLGGFDLPFGLPRELLETLGWPLQWEACMRHYAAMDRAAIRAAFMQFCAARPVGAKFAHRQTDRPAGSSPSMKWVQPPVAYMLHAGVPRLLDVGAYFPGLQPATAVAPRVALEAYPGLLARQVLGRRSYKSDDRAKQTPDRLIARKDVVHALETGQLAAGLRLKLSPAQHDTLVQDASGDSLDAVLCLMQAAWAQGQHLQGHPCYGLPSDIDPLEGWIVGA